MRDRGGNVKGKIHLVLANKQDGFMMGNERGKKEKKMTLSSPSSGI